jgi:DNA/RNA endonuclease G (NUC1)
MLSALLLAVLPARGIIDASLQMQLGNPSNAIANTNNYDHYLVQRTIEALDYSSNLGEPVWASWDLTAADVGTNARSAIFFTDTNLPPNFNRLTDSDYNGDSTVGINRGHLCPSEDRTDTRADNDLVFFMSNIMAQNAVNNSGVWAQFETYCRSLLSTNELLIICGPSGFGTNRIPSGKAVIPDYTWKIAVVVPTNSGTALSRITSSTRVIALKIPNTDAATNTWPHYVTSAAQIEVDTGFTFFTALPSNVATVLRNKVDGQTNPPPLLFTFSPTNGAAGTNVILTGANFAAATAVTFNGVSAAFIVNSNSQISATVPANDSSGFISVTTPSGTVISSSSFIVIGGGSGTGSNIYTGTLMGWDVNTVSNFGASPLPPTTNAPNLTVVGLTRGSGVVTNSNGAASAWGGVNFTSTSAALAIAASKFVTFSATANAGSQVSFSAVSRFDYRRSGTGPTNGVLQFQIGNGAFSDITNLNYSVITSGGGSIGPIDLTGFAALQNVGAGTNVTFRIVNWLGSGSTGSWYVNDTANSTAPDLALTGTVISVVPSAPAVAPSFTLLTFTNNQFQFTLTGTPGTNYIVQAATNLAVPNWIPLATNAAPFVFIQSNANLFPQRFYRGVVAP